VDRAVAEDRAAVVDIVVVDTAAVAGRAVAVPEGMVELVRRRASAKAPIAQHQEPEWRIKYAYKKLLFLT
jgi:hypothetical protein